jgi:NADH-quinone oxidoreductase subunit L
MMMVVCWVGFLIHVYATGYMAHETGYTRFFAYFNLFMFMMLLLVMGNNYGVMFVGWEGVGLCSYLLIGFYYDKKFAADAGKKAFIVNRIGDFGFLLGLFLIFNYFGTRGLHERLRPRQRPSRRGSPASPRPSASCSSSAPPASRRRSPSTSGCRTRWPARRPSPRSSTPRRWSPRASTWSSARTCSSGSRPTAMLVVAVVGALTALFAATIGTAQNDIKKVLAYSTVSQLGFMFLAAASARSPPRSSTS